MHVSIIGAGQIGKLVAFNMLTNQHVPSKLTLIDRPEVQLEGDRRDLLDATLVSHFPKTDFVIEAAGDDYSKIKGSKLVVVTASAPLTDKREELLKANLPGTKVIGEALKKYAPDAFVVVVANPMDIMLGLIQHFSGHPKELMVGSGPTLDTARMRRILPKYLPNGDLAKLDHAYALGQHGAKMVPVMDFLGLPADKYKEAREEIVNEFLAIKNFNATPRFPNRFSTFAPSANIKALYEGFFFKPVKDFPICAWHKKAFIGALGDITAKGVSNVHMPKLSDREEKDMMAAEDDLAETIKSVV